MKKLTQTEALALYDSGYRVAVVYEDGSISLHSSYEAAEMRVSESGEGEIVLIAAIANNANYAAQRRAA